MDLLEISAKLVAKSIIGGSGLAIAQMPGAIQIIYAKLKELFVQENTNCSCEREKARPVARPKNSKRGRKSVVTCLECGRKVQVLSYKHLLKEHGLTVFEYKEKHDLPAHYPLTCQSLRRRRSQILRSQRAGKC